MYKGIFDYFGYDISNNLIQDLEDPTVSFMIMHPALFHIEKIMEKQEIYKILSDHKHFGILRFVFHPEYSSYLFCYWILDILDILSNELFFFQSKIEIYVDEISYGHYMKEFKDFLRRSMHYLNRNKILPIYAKFLVDPGFHVEYAITFGTRFHVLFIKENLDHLSIQRIHFNIDI